MTYPNGWMLLIKRCKNQNHIGNQMPSLLIDDVNAEINSLR
jgi:hypothetical protein